ncbi:MAG TPA: sodium:solute symporter [Candidatus Obscuribacterales bacterium]
MNLNPSFWIDLFVIAAYFVSVVYVGMKFGQRENNLEGFALGGRSIPWWAVLASIVAAETSAATFLGTPGEGFELVNYTYLQIAIGTILGRIIVAFLFIKPFFDYNVYSIYEFLQVRFGNGTRKAASAIFLVTRVLASGARLYVAAIILAVAFTLITGTQPNLGQQLTIYLGSIFFITLLTAIYTSIGGIKAVVWTDCIQSSVMFGGAVSAIAILAVTMPGGMAKVMELVHHTHLPMITVGTEHGASLMTNVTKVLAQDYTIWAALLGSTFTTLATHGTDQDMVQRMLTATDYKKSRLSLITSGLADLPIGFVFLTIGILLHWFYQLHHDPALPHKNTEIFAYFILTQMPVGLRGLLVAGIFATSMGSLSAALNALATSFTRDFYKGGDTTDNDEQAVAAARRFTFVFAGLMILVASGTAYFVIMHPDSRIIPIVLGIFGYTYGSLLGVFLLGLLTKKRGSDVGNCIAMAAGGIVVALLTGLPNQMLELLGLQPIAALQAIPTVSFPWRIMFGSLTTLAVAALFRPRPTTSKLNVYNLAISSSVVTKG